MKNPTSGMFVGDAETERRQNRSIYRPIDFPAIIKSIEARIKAYNSGARFVLILKDGTAKTERNRSAVDRTRKLGEVDFYFYLRPDGELRPCAKGKRT